MKHKCDSCVGFTGQCSGIIVQDGIAYPCQYYLQYLRRKSLEQRIIEAGIPARWQNVLVNTECDDDNKDALDAAIRFVGRQNEQKYGLLLYGPVGTGKTHIACYALCLYMFYYQNAKGLFLSAPEVATQIRQLSDSDFFNKVIKKADVVLIDDIGMEKESDWTLEYLSSILNYFYASFIPYILTTNIPIDKLEGRIGTRLYSRILETAEVVFVGGCDRRRS